MSNIIDGTKDEIEVFLNGYNPKERVTAIEWVYDNNKVDLIIDVPNTNKKHIEQHVYKPYLFMKDIKMLKKVFYEGNSSKLEEAKRKHGITIEVLRTKNNKNQLMERLDKGYKFLVKTYKNHSDLITFFKSGGVDIYDEKYRKFFYIQKPVEQFMIQTGIRLFKGMDLYTDIHRVTFDIETTGLDGTTSRCFLIGVKDNRGFAEIIACEKLDDDESELEMWFRFADIIRKLQPSILIGYNTESFDFTFFIRRLEMMNVDTKVLKMSLNGSAIKRKPKSIKLGGDSEDYLATTLWGINIIDTAHAVRRAKAINSEIKAWNLKYIANFVNVGKPDRTYIPNGNYISKYWYENKYFIIKSNENIYLKVPKEFEDKEDEFLELHKDRFETLIKYKSDYYLRCGKNDTYQQIPEEYQSKPEEYLSIVKGYDRIITGRDIITKYLIDDLQETEDVDTIYNEATFAVSKFLPNDFVRTSTIGGSGSWQILMTAWSFENMISIPEPVKKREFTGGLSRSYALGFYKNAKKGDFAGLYPTSQIEHNIFPEYDITNALYRILLYFKLNRDKFKELAKSHPDENMRKIFDVKQLPLKIMNNSQFGSLSSEYCNWADFQCGERITCSGRQYLRKMVSYFRGYGAIPVSIDTDGAQFAFPEYTHQDIYGNILEEPILLEEIVYIDKNGNKPVNAKGKEFIGVDALLYRFNHDVMKVRYERVDNDGTWQSSIVFARKNYANLEFNGKIKLVGNSLKSSTLPKYVEAFINKGIKLLLHDKPKEFIEYYYEYLSTVYYKQIPLGMIANNAKIKMLPDQYLKENTILNILKIVFTDPYKIKAKKIKVKVIVDHRDNEWEIVRTTKIRKKFPEETQILEYLITPLITEENEHFELTMEDRVVRSTNTDFIKEVTENVTIEPARFDVCDPNSDKLLKALFNKLKANCFLESYSEKHICSIIDYIHKYDILSKYSFSKESKQIVNTLFAPFEKNTITTPFQQFADRVFAIYTNFRLLAGNRDLLRKFTDELKSEFMRYGNIRGAIKGKKAYMELLIADQIPGNLGEQIYYVNNGLSKTSSDTKIDAGKAVMNARIITEAEMLEPGEYNVEKYVNDFNNRIRLLTIPFQKCVQESLIIDNPKDRQYFTDKQVEMKLWTSADWGEAADHWFKKKSVSQWVDSIEDLFIMEEKEVKFWNNSGYDPMEIFEDFTIPNNLSLPDCSYNFNYRKYKQKLFENGIHLKRYNENHVDGDIVFLDNDDKLTINKFDSGIFQELKVVKNLYNN